MTGFLTFECKNLLINYNALKNDIIQLQNNIRSKGAQWFARSLGQRALNGSLCVLVWEPGTVLTLTDFFQVVVWTVSLFNLTQKPTFTEKKKAAKT